jgi:hypothetical protein
VARQRTAARFTPGIDTSSIRPTDTIGTTTRANKRHSERLQTLRKSCGPAGAAGLRALADKRVSPEECDRLCLQRPENIEPSNGQHRRAPEAYGTSSLTE